MNHITSIASMAGEVILWAAYGIVVRPENDPHVKRAEDAMRAMAHAMIPGRFLVVSWVILCFHTSSLIGPGLHSGLEIPSRMVPGSRIQTSGEKMAGAL